MKDHLLYNQDRWYLNAGGDTRYRSIEQKLLQPGLTTKWESQSNWRSPGMLPMPRVEALNKFQYDALKAENAEDALKALKEDDAIYVVPCHEVPSQTHSDPFSLKDTGNPLSQGDLKATKTGVKQLDALDPPDEIDGLDASDEKDGLDSAEQTSAPEARNKIQYDALQAEDAKSDDAIYGVPCHEVQTHSDPFSLKDTGNPLSQEDADAGDGGSDDGDSKEDGCDSKATETGDKQLDAVLQTIATFSTEINVEGYIDVDGKLEELNAIKTEWAAEMNVTKNLTQTQSNVEKQLATVKAQLSKESAQKTQYEKAVETAGADHARYNKAASEARALEKSHGDHVEELRRQLRVAEVTLKTSQKTTRAKTEQAEVTKSLVQANRQILADKTQQLSIITKRHKEIGDAVHKANKAVRERKMKVKGVLNALMKVDQQMTHLQQNFECHWKQWNPTNIARYVARLEGGKFAQFEDEVKAGCIRKKLKGRHMQHMSHDLLQCLGVEDMEDSLGLLSHFQTLTGTGAINSQDTDEKTQSAVGGASVSNPAGDSGGAAGMAQRTMDVLDENFDILSPIIGIFKTDLIPLDAVCAQSRFQDVFGDIGAFVFTAKLFAEKNIALQGGKDQHGLTVDEIAAINLYTQNCVYKELNRRLRSAQRSDLKCAFSFLRLLLTGLKKLPQFQGVLWRGVNTTMSDEYKKGAKLFWWGFSSCTKDIEALNNPLFLEKDGNRTLVRVECVKGVEIVDYSSYKSEAEVLLFPGTYFEVEKKLDLGHNLQQIHLKQINIPHEMVT